MTLKDTRVGIMTTIRCYNAWFGADPIYVSIVWKMLVYIGWLDYGCQIIPVHLLWALLFLKVYSTEEVNAGRVKTDEKTFREQVWFILEGIAKLDTVLVSEKSVICVFSFRY